MGRKYQHTPPGGVQLNGINETLPWAFGDVLTVKEHGDRNAVADVITDHPEYPDLFDIVINTPLHQVGGKIFREIVDGRKEAERAATEQVKRSTRSGSNRRNLFHSLPTKDCSVLKDQALCRNDRHLTMNSLDYSPSFLVRVVWAIREVAGDTFSGPEITGITIPWMMWYWMWLVVSDRQVHTRSTHTTGSKHTIQWTRQCIEAGIHGTRSESNDEASWAHPLICV